jgi:hypothetical protein
MSNEDFAATVALNSEALAALLEQVKQLQQGQAVPPDDFVPGSSLFPDGVGEEVVPEAPAERSDSAEHRR